MHQNAWGSGCPQTYRLSLLWVQVHTRAEAACCSHQSLFPAGEINTFQGNLNWVASREHSLSNPVWKGREEEFLPLCSSGESDSANLDHVAELLVRTGIEPQESLMILVPEAYDNHPHLQKNYPEVWLPQPTMHACQCETLSGCSRSHNIA